MCTCVLLAVPAQDGTRITFEGKGNETRGGPPADLVFIVRELPHPRFKRRGNDLELSVAVRNPCLLAAFPSRLAAMHRRLPAPATSCPSEPPMRPPPPLELKPQVPLVTALTESSVRVSGFDGRPFDIPIEGIQKTSVSKVVRGQGMPVSKEPGRRGDLIVHLEVFLPPPLSEAQKRAVRSALGGA